jgi:hypothetical protein
MRPSKLEFSLHVGSRSTGSHPEETQGHRRSVVHGCCVSHQQIWTQAGSGRRRRGGLPPLSEAGRLAQVFLPYDLASGREEARPPNLGLSRSSGTTTWSGANT